MDFLSGEIKQNYLKQRRLNSSQITLEISFDITYQTEQLINLLRTGDCTENDDILGMFDDDQDNQQQQQIINYQTIANEQLTGNTLTHFTLKVQNGSISTEEVINLLAFIDFCPNLEYLNLNLYSNSRYDYSKVNLSNKLSLLKKLKILVLNLKYNGVTEQQLSLLAQDISKIETLIELNISVEQTLSSSWNSLYVAFSGHRTLNTLKINSEGYTHKNIFKNNYKKMKRLVCKDIQFYNLEDEFEDDDQFGFDMFE